MKLLLLLLFLVPLGVFAQEEPIAPPFPPRPQPSPIIGQHKEIEPEFPGGQKALLAYLEENLRYPEAAKEANLQGRVYLSFVVNVDGTLSSVKIERGVSAEIDAEAKRLILEMPNWKPGENSEGRKIKSKCRLPIKFVLPE